MISDRNQTSSQPNQLSSSQQSSGIVGGTSSTNNGQSSSGGWPLSVGGIGSSSSSNSLGSSMTGYGQLNGFNSLMGPSLIMGSGVGSGSSGGGVGQFSQFNPYANQFNMSPAIGGSNFNHSSSSAGSSSLFGGSQSVIGAGIIGGGPNNGFSNSLSNTLINNSTNNTSSTTVSSVTSSGVNNQQQQQSGIIGSNANNSNGGVSGLSNFDQAVKYAAEANAKANIDKDYYEAIKLYGEAISMDSSDHRFYLNRSYCYAQLELYQLALDDAIQAISLNPTLAKCYFRKGQALAGLKKYREAEKSFLEVLRLEPDCQETRHELNMNKLSALSSAGYNDSIAHWAANKFGTIDDAVNNLHTLMNNPTTAGIINNPASMAGLINNTSLSSSSTIGTGLTGRNDTSSSSSSSANVIGGGNNGLIGGSSTRSNNPWDPTPGSPFGNSYQNQQYLNQKSQQQQQQQSLHQTIQQQQQQQQQQNGMNQKTSDNNSVSQQQQQQRSASFNQSSSLDTNNGLGNFMTATSYSAFNGGNDLMINRSRSDHMFGIPPSPASVDQLAHNSTSAAASQQSNMINGIGGSIKTGLGGSSYVVHEQFGNMKLSSSSSPSSSAITPPSHNNQSNSGLGNSVGGQSNLSGGIGMNGSSNVKPVGPIGRPLIGGYHNSGSEPSISPAASLTDSNTDTSSPSLDGGVTSAFGIKSMVTVTSVNGLGPLIGNNCVNNKHNNSVDNNGVNNSGLSNSGSSSKGTGAWGNSGTAFSYSDIVKKKPTAAEVVAMNNAANGVTKSCNGSVSSSGDENNGISGNGGGKSSGWSTVVEQSNGTSGSNQWSSTAADGSKQVGGVTSTTSTSNGTSTTTATSQSASAASKRPTNIWGYNGLRVANVSSTASKSTLHSMFSKFGRIKLIERINNKNVENQLWVFYDNEKSPVEVIAKYQGAIVSGISMNSTTGLRFFFAATDDQKDLKFSRPKQPQDNRGECYYWRTTNCFSRESCSLLHIPACKNIDAQVWMKMNRDPAAAAAAATTATSGTTTTTTTTTTAASATAAN